MVLLGPTDITPHSNLMMLKQKSNRLCIESERLSLQKQTQKLSLH